MHKFEAIENAILSKLEPLKSEGLKTLEPYAGQLDVEELEDLTFQFPCIYVIVQGLHVDPDNRSDQGKMETALLIGDRNIRGSGAAARGDTVSPGVYRLLSAARSKLNRQKAIAGFTALSIRYEGPVIYDPKRDICLYEARYDLKGAVT